MVIKAYEIAKKYHEGQVDKAGMPYINHPIAVAQMTEDVDERTVALLHDVVEDTEYTEEQLREDFPAHIADAVMAMTRHAYGKETYAEFIKRVKKNPLARKVKTFDVQHNMKFRGFKIAESLAERYEKALKELKP